MRGAEKAMAKPIPRLTDKKQAAPSGDKRYYVSLAIYWWPDPEHAAAKNNHGVWYDAQTAVYAHYVGRDDLARQIVAAVPERRLEKQLAADGTLPLELARTRPMNYSMYVLRAYLTPSGILGWHHSPVIPLPILDPFKHIFPSFYGKKDRPRNFRGRSLL